MSFCRKILSKALSRFDHAFGAGTAGGLRLSSLNRQYWQSGRESHLTLLIFLMI